MAASVETGASKWGEDSRENGFLLKVLNQVVGLCIKLKKISSA